MLNNDAPGGVAQFYDRDTKAEMASIGMEAFQEFMVKPERLEKILERLEKSSSKTLLINKVFTMSRVQVFLTRDFFFKI